MKITKSRLNKAVEANIITPQQAQNLIEFFNQFPDDSPRFNLTNVFYYFGGLIAIGAMTLFMTLGWEMYGGWGICFLSLCYAILGLALTHKLDRLGFYIPAGVCATFVIALTPLAIYGFQQAMDWWPDYHTYRDYHVFIRWNWIFMELGTLAVGIILAWIYRYPFMMMPIAVTLWYISMDLASMISGGDYFSFELIAIVSMYFGLIMMLIAFWVDVRSSQTADYAFWLYIFGVMAFWCGLSGQHSISELSKFLYMCINVLLIFIGVILARKVFVIFGALGVCFYLGYLAYQVFQLSYFFPVVLTIIGFAIIYLGILWQKNELLLTHKLRSILPKPVRDLLEARDEWQ